VSECKFNDNRGEAPEAFKKLYQKLLKLPIDHVEAPKILRLFGPL